jgi:hypothetical protein
MLVGESLTTTSVLEKRSASSSNGIFLPPGKHSDHTTNDNGDFLRVGIVYGRLFHLRMQVHHGQCAVLHLKTKADRRIIKRSYHCTLTSSSFSDELEIMES